MQRDGCNVNRNPLNGRDPDEPVFAAVDSDVHPHFR